MREIRFREWDKEQAKMKKDFRFDEFNDVNDYFADNDFIFMQFTGLNDKNTDQNGQNRSKHSISVESMEMLGSKDGEPQKSNTYQVSSTSQQSQVVQRKSVPQYNDVPDIDVDCVDCDSQEIPF